MRKKIYTFLSAHLTALEKKQIKFVPHLLVNLKSVFKKGIAPSKTGGHHMFFY